jgi:hypothetical protein
MSTTKRMEFLQQGATRLQEAEIPSATDTQARRKLTLAENVILTIKVLAGFGLVGAALWAISLWKAVR